jgi:hypothetical protein
MAVGLAIVSLAVAAHFAVSGIGPFVAQVTNVRAAQDGAAAVIATISVRNDGSSAGTAFCRVTNPADAGIQTSEVVYSPMIPPRTTIEFDYQVSFGAAGQPLNVACTGP